MKDTKIPLGWLIPIVGIILLLGWFLGRSGWNVTEIDGGIVKLAPPTPTLVLQPSATHQEIEPSPTYTPIPPILSPTPTSTSGANILPSGEVVSPESLAKFIGGKPEFWTKRGPVVWGYWDKGNNMTFRHPGNNTILTYWAGFPEPRNAGGCLIIIPEADNATRYVKCPSGTQAEFEADGVGFHLIDYTGFFQ